MGTDIKCLVQIRTNTAWETVGEVDLDRNYFLFNLLAGVRSKSEWPAPISEPRGLPDDLQRKKKPEEERLRELRVAMYDVYDHLPRSEAANNLLNAIKHIDQAIEYLLDEGGRFFEGCYGLSWLFFSEIMAYESPFKYKDTTNFASLLQLVNKVFEMELNSDFYDIRIVFGFY